MIALGFIIIVAAALYSYVPSKPMTAAQAEYYARLCRDQETRLRW